MKDSNIIGAVNEIIVDVMDRAGLGNEWDNIEDSIKEEIAKTWFNIIKYWSEK